MRDPAVSVSDSAIPDTHERLSVNTKLAFGAGDLGPAIATGVLSFFQLFFLTTVAGLPANVAGSILLVVKIWDALSDPVVGWLSDRTVSKHGRRRPWLLYGALPFGISFFLLWLVPPFGDGGKIAYYLVLMLIFNTLFTVVNVPYTALTPELTRDYDERTSLNAYRFAFSIGGGLFAATVHQLIINGFCANPDNCQGVVQQPGYVAAGALWGIMVALPFLWCFFGTKERYTSAPSDDKMGLVDQVRVALSNRPFLFVIGIYLCSWLAVQITASIIIFYVTFWLENPDLIPITLFAVQGSAFVFLFIWNAVSRRIGKKAVYITGMLFWIVVQSVLFFVQPGQESLTLILAVLAGIGIATAYLIPWSMMPDVIELDELQTGQRREGIFYGFMVLLQKLGLALGLFLVGQVLAFQGFREDAPIGQQPESALLAIRLMLGPIPAVVLICGIVLAIFYPITKQKHAEMLVQIQARRSVQEE
ncbi:MAG: MFS transporter [Chloroflexi bacterium AL-W]|nr:MFS transporter [Chloroflexi bacterium AL-N1]NOK70914.1 MFS transporter [Chloroflexi bacterium AL-N10]NOK78583.1 MFS transporter [Chloroflexi bacterium AL-N5]NOK85815.1 MFS transporter [Chloroflexi bacterium AL-W]NOK92731.1 MFS transporter [Chloroflexi bacterium AL-N15]